MYEVDARGLSCPQPLMMTNDAIKAQKGAIKVLVSEPHQRTNVEKFAKDKGKKVTVQLRLKHSQHSTHSNYLSGMVLFQFCLMIYVLLSKNVLPV